MSNGFRGLSEEEDNIDLPYRQEFEYTGPTCNCDDDTLSHYINYPYHQQVSEFKGPSLSAAYVYQPESEVKEPSLITNDAYQQESDNAESILNYNEDSISHSYINYPYQPESEFKGPSFNVDNSYQPGSEFKEPSLYVDYSYQQESDNAEPTLNCNEDLLSHSYKIGLSLNADAYQKESEYNEPLLNGDENDSTSHYNINPTFQEFNELLPGPIPTKSIYEYMKETFEAFDVANTAWTFIVDPFCAITSVCSILMNCDVFVNYISQLNDIFSSFISKSLLNLPDPFDLLSIPQLLWDDDPVVLINRIYSIYSQVPDFNLFDIKIKVDDTVHYLPNVCVDVQDTFQSSINNFRIITHEAIVTLSFSRYFGDKFYDNKFALPLSYQFTNQKLELFGFIYVIHPLSTASHYISVIKKRSSFYVCNGKPIKIDNIKEFMLKCNIVTCFYIDPNYNNVLNPSRDFEEGILFSLNDFKFFKFHSTNPFLEIHPEFKSSDYIDDFQNLEILEEQLTQNDQVYIPSDDDLLGEILENQNEGQNEDDSILNEESQLSSINYSVPEEDFSLSTFLSVNRFLYDALILLNNPTLKSVANLLEMNFKKLRDNLIQNEITTNIKELKALALNIELLDPPPVYLYLSGYLQSEEKVLIDSRYIEFAIPCTYYHFDYYNLLFNRSSFPQNLKNGIPKNFDFSEIDPDIDHYFNVDSDYKTPNVSSEYIEFREKMINIYEKAPEIFKNLDGDQRFLINSHISIAFLYGNVEIAKGGIGSPHLKGTFSMSARKQGTGYLNLDSILNSKKPPDMVKLQNIMEWLKANNPLYAEISPINVEFYHTIIEQAFTPRSEVIGIAKLPCNNLQPSFESNDDFHKIPITLPDSEGKKELKYVRLEEALSLCFPMLFPFGIVPKIPGKTLKEKSLSLLSTHEFYRCGRLECSLILFLYNAISSHNASFVQNQITVQRTNIPQGASRDIPQNIVLRNDPSMPEYWLNRQSQVRAMCSELGDPDLMITFTFANKWPEVKECEDIVNEYGYDNVDIRFCPFEEMMIWHNRFSEIKKNSFGDLIKNMNFGNVSNYCWRLEFQARGAPHVHALIWLEKRLSLDTISKNFFARLPNKEIPRLHDLVTNNMIHTCLVSRCKGGIESASCKYGFPKSSCQNVHVNNEGNLIIPRNDNESRVVEYSPYFLIKWGGHCHVNILLHEERLECPSNAIYYIVKYNFKNEPNLTVNVVDVNNTSYQTRFHARIVSVEEATTKIVSTDYFGSSMSSTYISIKSPEERHAAFRKGEQTQLTFVEKYFNRPPELERMGILSFFSNYNVVPLGISNQQRINHLIKQYGNDSDQYLKPTRPVRPKDSLSKDSKWEQENLPATQLIKDAFLYPSHSLLNAKALKINLRTKPQIVLTERFTCTSNIEEFFYVYLMLNGSWRSDDEMKANQETWEKALEYHGLKIPDNDGMLSYYQFLIAYMINSPRYGTKDILRNISMMNYNMLFYLSHLKGKVGLHEKMKIDEIIKELNKLAQAKSSQIHDINEIQNSLDLNQYIHYSFTDDEISDSRNKLVIEFLPKLNPEQNDVFNKIKTRLEAHQQVTAFVKGKAGTGKSFLIHTIINYLTSNSIPFIVCASTGIAASLINGKTVHSAFGLFTKKTGTLEEDVLCSLDVSKPNGYAMSKVQLIIIDEVTMISGKVLAAIENGLRKIMAQIHSPLQSLQFGGKSLILFGDLAQVPAVTRSLDDFLESMAQFHENENYEGFNRWKLSTIMRQSPDETVLIKILDFIRDYQDGQKFDPLIEEELQKVFLGGLIEERIDDIDNFVGHDDPNGMVITFTNKNAQLYNQLILEKRIKENNCKPINLTASFYIIEKTHFVADNKDSEDNQMKKQAALSNTRIASDSEVKIFCGAMKKKLVNSIIPFSLKIIPNARVMLLQNLDVNAGLINGARGTVVDYDIVADGINVLFDFQDKNDSPFLITRKKSVEYQINNGKLIFMYMFPIKLSWAITSHKSQGQTLTKAAINIGETAFAHGSFYVALSRVKSLNGLRLFGLEEWPKGGPKIHMNPFIQSKENDQVENEFI